MHPAGDGFLASGLCRPDELTLTRVFAPGFSNEAIQQVMVRAAEIFPHMERNRFSARKSCWTFENALFHFSRRPEDGICLGVFTCRETEGFDAALLDQLFEEFHTGNLRKTS